MGETLHVVGAILLQGDQILIARRAPHKSAAGLWEFPGGKVESNETSADALEREIQEELRLAIKPINTFDTSDTMVGELIIRLEVIVCQVTGIFQGFSGDHDQLAWVVASELDSYTWAAPDLPAVHALKRLKALSLLHTGKVTSETVRLI